MNKFVKIVLILSGCLFGFGIIFTLAAFVMGATVWDMDYVDRLGLERFKSNDFHVNVTRDKDDFLPELDVDFNSGSDEVQSGDGTNQVFAYDNVRNINLEVGASTLKITYADVDKAEVHYEDAVGVDMELDEGELDIECHAFGNVEVLIPRDVQMDSIDLEVGAGQVIITDVSFRYMDAEIGAGELIVHAPNAQDEYDYNVDCAIGEVRIGDAVYTGISSTDRKQGGNYYMDIDCGAGRVEIRFAE